MTLRGTLTLYFLLKRFLAQDRARSSSGKQVAQTNDFKLQSSLFAMTRFAMTSNYFEREALSTRL